MRYRCGNLFEKWTGILAGFSISVIVYFPILQNYFGLGTVSQVAAIGLILFVSFVRVSTYKRLVDNQLVNTVRFVIASIVGLLLASYFVSGTGEAAIRNVLLLSAILALALSVPESSTIFTAKYFFAFSVIFGVFTSFKVVSGYLINGSLDYETLSYYEFYLSVSRGISLSIVSLIAYIAYGKSSNNFIWTMLAAVLFVGLSFSLGRGGLISTFIVCFFIAIERLWSSRIYYAGSVSPVKVLLTVGVGLSIMVGIVIKYVPRTYRRLELLLQGRPFNPNATSRAKHWMRGLNEIAANPILGTGAADTGSPIGSGYPHNMFLQVWADGGVLPLALLVIVICIIIAKSIRLRRKIRYNHNFSTVVLFALVILFLEYNKSLNLYTARDLCAVTLLYVTVLTQPAKINRAQ